MATSSRQALFGNKRTGGWLRKARAELKSICHIVGLYPTTVLWPLLVLGLVLAIGIWGVTHVAKSEEKSSRDRAATLALDAALWVQQHLTSAIAPVMLSAAMVSYNPQMSQVEPLFRGLAPVMLAQAPNDSIRVLQIVPNGIVTLSYPLARNENASGLDVFASPSNRDGALKTVRDRTVTLAGPMNFVQGGYGVIVRKPIFISGVSEDETFGIARPLNPICGAPCAYDAVRRTKFWGFISALVELGNLSLMQHSRLGSLEAMGYLYELEAPEAVGNSSRLVAASSRRPRDPVEAVVWLPNNQWILRVSPDHGWSSSWYGGLLAGVIVLALATALLLFFALVAWRRHQMLLEALLPKQLIKELRGEEASSLYKCRCPNIQMAGETPADLLLDMMGDLLEGRSPDLSHVVYIRTALLRNHDLYTPLHVQDHINEANLDAEVAQALVQQLVGGRREPNLGGPPHRVSALTEDKQSSCAYDFDTVSGALAFVISPDAHAALPVLSPTAAAAAGGGGCGGNAGCQANDAAVSVVSGADRSEVGVQSTPLVMHRLPQRVIGGSGCAVRMTMCTSNAGSASSVVMDASPPAPPPPLTAHAAAVDEEDERYGNPNTRIKTMCRGRLFAVATIAAAADGDGNSVSGGDGASADGMDDHGTTAVTSHRRFLNGIGALGTYVASAAPEAAAGEGPKSGTSIGTVSSTGAAAVAAAAPKLTAVSRMLRGRDASPYHRFSGAGGVPNPTAASVATAAAAAAAATGNASAAASTALVEKSNGRLGLALSCKPRRAESSNGGGYCGSASLPIHVGAQCLSQQDAATITVAVSNSIRTPGVVVPESTAAEMDADSEAPAQPPDRALPAPAPALLEEVERLLSRTDSWHFDAWALQAASGGHALSVLGYYLIHRQGLIARFRMKPVVLARLLRQIEAGYQDNPYHNATHAADVLQSLHVLLHAAGLHVHYLDQLGLLAAYFAAMIHDFGHPGFTGDFLTATSDPLALRYNDRSPLENHHCAAAFALMKQRPELDVLAPLGQTERNSFRKLVIDLVLATDMKQHFSILSHFNTVHRLAAYQKQQHDTQRPPQPGASGHSKSTPPAGSGGSRVQTEPSDLQVVMVVVSPPTGEQDGGPAASTGDGAGGAAAAAGGCSDGNAADAAAASSAAAAAAAAPRPVDETERILGLQVALKCADIGNLGRELECYRRWVDVLEEEFFRQGGRERELGLPISPLSDRTKQGVSKSQTGFFDFVALPLVHAMASAFPGAQPLMRNFLANYNYCASEAANAGPSPSPPSPPPAATAAAAAAAPSSTTPAPAAAAANGGAQQ